MACWVEKFGCHVMLPDKHGNVPRSINLMWSSERKSWRSKRDFAYTDKLAEFHVTLFWILHKNTESRTLMHSEYLQNVALWHCALTPLGFPSGTMVKKKSTCQCRRLKRHGLDPWVGKIPWSRKRQLQYSWLKISMDRGASHVTVHRLQRVRHTGTAWACFHYISVADSSKITEDDIEGGRRTMT